MTSLNYLENVPVKISENYKPPPRLYQLPQAIQHKLLLSSDHFQQAPQYSYDFQLEHKVQAKIPEWSRMRQLEREARRERKEKREQLRLKEVQAQQRQLLGAVSYPDAEELSSTDSDDDSQQTKSAAEITVKTPNHTETHNEDALRCSQTSSFHNILQPTVLKRNSDEWGTAVKVSTNCSDAAKLLHAFNYKEFENDTSSPFDNIELKSINDLDILAQVLHNTQLKTADASKTSEQKPTQVVAEEQVAKENEENMQIVAHCIEENSNANSKYELVDPNAENKININVLEEHTKQTTVNVSQQRLQNSNIPDAALSAPITTATSTQLRQPQEQSSYGYHVASRYAPYLNAPPQCQQQATYMPYTLYNGLEQPSSQYTKFDTQHHAPGNIYANQNYLCANGLSAYYSPTHATQIVGYNANSYGLPHGAAKTEGMPSMHGMGGDNELSLKSKSVPDILKELRNEVRNSELRRTRNNSHSLKETDEEVEEEAERKSANSSAAPKKPLPKSTAAATQFYSKLAAPARKLAKSISSMGFPLERVAKVTQMFGTDDKKIIEHLIPLSELVDLGFDEVKISEALMKFDNNKEKAIEYLIS